MKLVELKVLIDRLWEDTKVSGDETVVMRNEAGHFNELQSVQEVHIWHLGGKCIHLSLEEQ